MAEHRFDCLCVGIVVADHSCTPIDSIPEAGQLVVAHRLPLSTGGCAANVAVDLAKLGRNVAVVGRVGEDALGRFVCESLAAENVDTQFLLETPEVETSGTLIVNVAGEDRRFIHCFGANAVFDGSEVNDELLSSAPVLYLGGYLLMPQLTADAVTDMFQRAQAVGVKTVLDVAVPDTDRLWGRVEPVLRFTDVFLPNADEARLITGLDDPWEQAGRFCAAGAGTVVVTRGDAGAVLRDSHVEISSGVYSVPFVDGTGSGDAFDAGFIYGMLQGEESRKCLRLGSALGASCVRQTGATTGVFSAQELDQFLTTNRLDVDSR